MLIRAEVSLSRMGPKLIVITLLALLTFSTVLSTTEYNHSWPIQQHRQLQQPQQHKRPLHQAPDGHYHQRIYRDHHSIRNTSSAAGHQPLSWTTLAEVDGLKNEEVVMFIVSTWSHNGLYLRERIMASSRTWMRLFANVIVIVEDNFHVRYAMRHCRAEEFIGYTTFRCPHEPTFLLTRRCTDEYYVANGPCCKVDAAIDFLTNKHTALMQHTKYMLLSDDDQYWRADQLLRWLAAVEVSGVSDAYAIAGNSHESEIQQPHGNIWHIKGCGEIQTSGWYQPLMLNRLALQQLAVAAAGYGFRDMCRAFDLSQDAGIGMLLWMYQLHHIQIPNTDTNDQHQGIPALHPDTLSLHFVKHEEEYDHCEDGRRWPEQQLHQQNIVIGCGDVDQKSPGHDGVKHWADMYDVWNYFQQHGEDVPVGIAGVHEFEEAYVLLQDSPARSSSSSSSGSSSGRAKLLYVLSDPKPGGDELQPSQWRVGDVVRSLDGDEIVIGVRERVELRVVPKLLQLPGYRDTRHYSEHDIHKYWVPFTLQDCEPPGSIDH